MADHLALFLRHQFEDGVAAVDQRVDEPGLRLLAESVFLDEADRLAIPGGRGPDRHHAHDSLIPFSSLVPRRNSSAVAGLPPARCNFDKSQRALPAGDSKAVRPAPRPARLRPKPGSCAGSSGVRPCRQASSRTTRRERATGRERGCATPWPAAASRSASPPCRSSWHRSRPRRLAASGSACRPRARASASTIKRRADVHQRCRAGRRRFRQGRCRCAPSAPRAGVEACVHLHDHHAGFMVARHDRPLDRRSTAPARQQRGVAVVGSQAACPPGSATGSSRP